MDNWPLSSTPQHNQSVYNATMYWEDRRYVLGPANVQFFYTPDTGIGIVEASWVSLGSAKAGECRRIILGCREAYDAKIYVNSDFWGQWTNGRFTTYIRHEFGHAVA